MLTDQMLQKLEQLRPSGFTAFQASVVLRREGLADWTGQEATVAFRLREGIRPGSPYELRNWHGKNGRWIITIIAPSNRYEDVRAPNTLLMSSQVFRAAVLNAWASEIGFEPVDITVVEAARSVEWSAMSDALVDAPRERASLGRWLGLIADRVADGMYIERVGTDWRTRRVRWQLKRVQPPDYVK